MSNSAGVILATGFNVALNRWLLRKTTIGANGECINVVDDGGGDKVLEINATASDDPFRYLVLPNVRNLTVSAKINIQTKVTTGGAPIFTVNHASEFELCSLLYRKNPFGTGVDDIAFRDPGSFAYYFKAEAVIRNSSGTILARRWFHGYTPGGAVTSLYTSPSLSTDYRVELRVFMFSAININAIGFGMIGTSYTGTWKLWFRDLYVAVGGLPAPANPTFGVLTPASVISHDAWTLGGYSSPADKVAAVTTSEPDGDATYVYTDSGTPRQSYRVGASGLGAVNVFAVTAWMNSRVGGTGTQQHVTIPNVFVHVEYGSPLQLNAAINATDSSTTVAYTGGPPSVADNMVLADDVTPDTTKGEIVQVTAVDTGAGTMTISRGLLSSTKAAYPSGSNCYKMVIATTVLGGTLVTTVPSVESFDDIVQLNGGIDASVTTGIAIDGGTVQLTVGDVVRIDSELMRITALTGSPPTSMDVSARGYDGSSAATHSDNTEIKYQGYFPVFIPVAGHPLGGSLSVADLDRMIVGLAHLASSRRNRVSSIALEYMTHADAVNDLTPPVALADNVKVV